MKIGSRDIKNFGQPYIIAELGSNHNGDMDLAQKLINEAKKAGCDCVKFQSWTKDTVFSKKVYQDNYFLNDDYRNRTDYTLEQIVEKFSISEKELLKMREYCDKVGIDFASTPFSNREVDFLVDELKASFVKVASMDLNNYAFLRHIAEKGKPIVVSTGFGTLWEIDRAIQTIEETGNKKIVILHCVANYPPKDENINLNNIEMLRNNYPNYPVGFSDHSIGVEIPLAAVAKGACVIEKHFTLDKGMFGWDHKVSATPDEMEAIVKGSKRIVAALGSYRRIVTEDDYARIPSYRRSIVAARDIPSGKTIERADIDFKRPGTGISPAHLELVVGRVAKRGIEKDSVISKEDMF
jgi:N-acetylneuraminate synthase